MRIQLAPASATGPGMLLGNALKKGLLALAALLLATTVQAHHSAAQYDFTQNVKVTGKIIELSISNPHLALTLAVKQADGSTRQITFEGHSRNNIYRRGWRPDMVKAGDTVTIYIAPKRDGEDGGYVQSWELADGTKF